MFNDRYGLTEAVLKGRKTMTRRVMSLLVSNDDVERMEWGIDDNGKANVAIFVDGVFSGCVYPMYQPGDVVAVAQSYNQLDYGKHGYATNSSRSCGIKRIYAEQLAGWTNKMFVRADLMPHQIRITDIKVERLQDISDEDCLKEGVYVNPNPPKWREYDPYEPWPPHVKPYKITTYHGYYKPQAAFAHLFNAISGKGTWENNPFVFAYSFELIK